MRVISLLLTFFVLCIQSRAATYYFSSSSGDDSRTAVQAQNPATPWKSIQKLNSFFASLQPGDSVLFKRGDTFFGGITVKKSGKASSPIVLSAYGTGAKPVITGFTQLTGWTPKGGGIYETTTSLPNEELMMVTVNQKLQPMGRYPNSDAPDKGYLSFEDFSNSGTNVHSITDDELPSSPDWKGAEVVARLNHWIIGRSTIASHKGSTLVFKKPIWGLTWKKFGYFIQNDIRTLDQVGEWYYNPSTNKLSMFFGTQSPSQFQVQAATVEDLLIASRQSYVSVEGLSFRGANDDAVSIAGGTGFSVRNSDILFSGRSGLSAYNSPMALRVENCTFTHSNNNGIEVGGTNGVLLGAVIRGNTIRNSGLNEGKLDITSKTGIGMNLGADGLTVEQNTIDSTGNHGIIFSGNHILIKNNLIQNFNSVLDDGGGIYIIRGVTEKGINRTITGNIILNGLGALQGTDKSWVGSSGIYTDDKVHDLEVIGNTIANCVTTGIYVHNSSIITLRGNTLYNNGVQLILRHDNVAPDYPVRELNVKQNILFSPQPWQYVTDVRSIKDDLNLMGSLDSNYHCRPLNEDMVGYTSYVSSGKSVQNIFDLKGWQSASVHDKNSRITARQLAAYKLQGLIGTNRVNNGTVESNLTGYFTNLPGTMAWVKGKLDGGTLQASVPASSYYYSVSTVAGAITAGRRYVLRFSVQSERDTVLTVTLKNGSTHLIAPQSVRMTPTRRDYELLVEATAGANQPVLSLITNAPGLRFWIDNLLLQEAEVNLQEPDKLMQLLYNASPASRTLPLAGNWVDVTNKRYSGAVTLSPYASVVLLQDTSAVVAKPNQAPTVSLTSPTANSSFAAGASVTVSATAQDSDGSVAKVEFYQGTTLLGTATQSPYTITWNKVPAGNYTLTAVATDNEDLKKVSSEVKVNFATCSATGSILREFWSKTNGTSVADIPLNTKPTSSSQLTAFEAPSNGGDNYGQRIRGYICAPVSGQYTFYIASDDNSELWLSTSDNPQGKARIAFVSGWTAEREWNKFSSQKSVAIALEAGKKYYIEALHKEGGNADHLAAGWQTPGSITIDVIPGSVLSPFVVVNKAPTVSLTSPTANSNFTDGASVTVSATAQDSDGSVAKVEFYQGTTLIGTATQSPYTITWNKVPAGNYTLTAVATDDEGVSATSDAITILVAMPAPAPSLTSLNVNFQDSETQTPKDWVADYGQSYGARNGTNQGRDNVYGWLGKKEKSPIDLTANSRNRKSMPDILRVTLMHMQAKENPEGIWEVKVPNGSYTVSVTVGDQHYIDSRHQINVEGVPAIVNFIPNWIERFKTVTVDVTVTDGRLTVDAEGGENTKLNFITIKPSNNARTAASSTSTPANLSVTATTMVTDPVAQEVSPGTSLRISSVYPNPSTSSFNVIVQAANQQPVNVFIYDFSGRMVESKTGVAANSTLQIGQQLPRGMYLLQVRQGNQKAEARLTKM